MIRKAEIWNFCQVLSVAECILTSGIVRKRYQMFLFSKHIKIQTQFKLILQ